MSRLMRWLVLLLEFDIQCHLKVYKRECPGLSFDFIPVTDSRVIDDDFPDEEKPILQ